ncbi:MAG TPA: chemotaxis protein CheC [Bacillota bacterium]|jgi:chemotaxis protein CheC|nr:chemotaxis protein CheC [Bacillota bacterium]
MDVIQELNELQLDALREVGNIGAGHAATVLSQMLNQRVEMTVPRISILPLGEVCENIGGSELPMVGVFMRVFGDAPSNLLYLYPREGALTLADMIIGRPKRPSIVLGEIEGSALKEIANILTGAYIYALSAFTNLNMITSVPGLAFDMAGAILNSVLSTFGNESDYALVIETQLQVEDVNASGHFFLVPDPDSLSRLLEALGVRGGCQRQSGSECPK